MTTGSSGTFWWGPRQPVLTFAIASTTSIPSTTLPKTAYPKLRGSGETKSRNGLSTRLMKNWLVAESTTAVLAIAIVPRRFLRPFIASFMIGASVGFWFMSFVKPPPWIMNPSMTRWKIVPS